MYQSINDDGEGVCVPAINDDDEGVCVSTINEDGEGRGGMCEYV